MSRRELAMAVYGDAADAAVREDATTPRLELRRVQYGDPAGAVPLYLDIIPTPAWMSDAACAGQDPRMFDLTDGGGMRLMKDGGRAVCARCPVAAECYEYGKGDQAKERRWSQPGAFSPWETGLWGGVVRPGDPSQRHARVTPPAIRRRTARPEQVAARLRELRKADPGWPNMPPTGRQVERHWVDTQPQKVRRHLMPVPSEPEAPTSITPRDAMWHEIDREYVAQGQPDIVPTQWGVFVSTLDGGWPDGILLTLPITEDDLAEARRMTGRSMPWDEATVAMVENAIRAKAGRV